MNVSFAAGVGETESGERTDFYINSYDRYTVLWSLEIIHKNVLYNRVIDLNFHGSKSKSVSLLFHIIFRLSIKRAILLISK